MPPPTRDRVRRLRRFVRRAVLARRRSLAALCAGIAVVTGLHAATASPPPTVAVPTAAHDLPAGTVLDDTDVTSVSLPPAAVPAGVTPRAVGRVLAAPLRAGEPITDVRLVGAGLAAAHPDLATLPVRLPDAALVSLLEAGDRIDLIATDPQAGGSRVVAAGALVLAIPDPVAAQGAATPAGALVVLGVEPAAVPTVSEAGVRWFLSYSYSR